MSDTGWWVISSEELLASLQRVADGEHPDEVYLDLVADYVTEQENGE